MSTNPTTAHAKACGKMPESYNGKPEAHKGFKTQMKVYLRINKDIYTTDKDCCLFILSMIQDGGWVQLYVEECMEDMINKNKFHKIDDLWTQLDRFFTDWNAEDQAATQLKKFQQKALTAQEYFVQFVALAMKAGITATDTGNFQYLCWVMNQNLNGPLVDNLYHQDSIPTTFQAYHDTIENLDTVWRQRMEDVKGRDCPQRSEETKKGNDTPKKKSRGREDVPMDIDRNKGHHVHVGWLSAKEERKHKEEGLCFKYHKKGHVSQNCDEKNTSRSTPQKKSWDIWVMTTEEHEDLMKELKGFAQANAWARMRRPP